MHMDSWRPVHMTFYLVGVLNYNFKLNYFVRKYRIESKKSEQKQNWTQRVSVFPKRYFT